MLISLGTSLSIIIPTASSGAYRHLKVMDNILKPGIRLGLFGIVGGVLGGIIASMLPTQILKIIFGCLLLFIAIRNLISANKNTSKVRAKFNLINIAVVGVLVGISYNSKTTKKGDIFICLIGEHTDGHEFAKSAIENGAAALLVERKVEGTKIPQVVVSSTRHKIADIADRFYSSQSKEIGRAHV